MKALIGIPLLLALGGCVTYGGVGYSEPVYVQPGYGYGYGSGYYGYPAYPQYYGHRYYSAPSTVYVVPQHRRGMRDRDGDRDRDGIPNRWDRDRDGDGVRNRDDRRPNNPHRH